MKKIGTIICDRYRTCAGGKCFRSLRAREGAFERCGGEEIELVGYTTCDGCPGGNVEYAVDEMEANGAEAIYLATGGTVLPPGEDRAVWIGDRIEQLYRDVVEV